MLLIMHVSIFDTAVILYSLKLFICIVLLTDASCKWSNEGCTTNNECCSGSCITRHPGTGPRCEKSSLLRPCLYNYHCENRAICGSKNKCCSDYWNDCRSSKDCCDPVHVCLYTRGFVYKKCLYGPVKPRNSGNSIGLSLKLITYLYIFFKSFFISFAIKHLW
jgi:hypothetical protein